MDLCTGLNQRVGLFLQNRRHMRELGSLRKTASTHESRSAKNAFCSPISPIIRQAALASFRKKRLFFASSPKPPAEPITKF
jgi:hypothetical protein